MAFLPEEDLQFKTIEIYFDLKVAKRDCKKDQKVIKVPNPNVFKIASKIMVSRGIKRIISDKQLISEMIQNGQLSIDITFKQSVLPHQNLNPKTFDQNQINYL